jgi:hypothetical protein
MIGNSLKTKELFKQLYKNVFLNSKIRHAVFEFRNNVIHKKKVITTYAISQSPLTLRVWILLRWGALNTSLSDKVCQW